MFATIYLSDYSITFQDAVINQDFGAGQAVSPDDHVGPFGFENSVAACEELVSEDDAISAATRPRGRDALYLFLFLMGICVFCLLIFCVCRVLINCYYPNN